MKQWSLARGAAFGDLNNDGWIDVVTTVWAAHPQVFFNRGGKRALADDYSARALAATAMDSARACK